MFPSSFALRCISDRRRAAPHAQKVIARVATAGSCVWTPKFERDVPHLLKLEVLSEGEIIATETAQFSSVPSCTVTFDANGGVASEKSRSVLMEERVGALPDVSRVGYAFLGWFTSQTGGTEVSATDIVTNSEKYFAHWQPTQYTVSFDANGGEGVMENQHFVYDVGQALPTNSFVREGYVFAGWTQRAGRSADTYSNGMVVSNLTADADGVVTLMAVWEKLLFTVCFDLSGHGARKAGGDLLQSVKWKESAVDGTILWANG